MTLLGTPREVPEGQPGSAMLEGRLLAMCHATTAQWPWLVLSGLEDRLPEPCPCVSDLSSHGCH